MAEFWGKLFENERNPTGLLQDLLFGVAKHIKDAIEPTTEKRLTPEKLARFYREVDGDSDELFLELPHQALGYIYRALHCRHGLQQPADDDSAAPTVPYLEPSGFTRWQIIQILLDPDENARILSKCLTKYDIVNLSTGERFPKVLPRSAFPVHADLDMTKWHEEVYEGLQKGSLEERRRSTPNISPPASNRSRPPSPISNLNRHPDYKRKKPIPKNFQRYAPPTVEVFPSENPKPRSVSPLRRSQTMRSRSEDRPPFGLPQEDRQYRPESYYMPTNSQPRRHSSAISSTTFSSESSETEASDASSRSYGRSKPSLYRPKTEQLKPSKTLYTGSRITSAPLLSKFWPRSASKPQFSVPSYATPSSPSYRSPSYTNRYQPPTAPSPPPQPQSAPVQRPKYYHRTSSSSTARASSTPRAASPPPKSSTRHRSHSGGRPRSRSHDRDRDREYDRFADRRPHATRETRRFGPGPATESDSEEELDLRRDYGRRTSRGSGWSGVNGRKYPVEATGWK